MIREESLARSARLIAPSGRYRCVLVDTFTGPTSDTLLGDFRSLADAAAVAKQFAGTMKPCYVYNDRGELLFSAGER